MSCRALRRLPLAWGVQAVLTVGVVAADVAADEELHAVTGKVRFVDWDGAQVAAGVGRQLVLIVGVMAADVAAADEELDAVAGMARFGVWHGAQVAARVGRAAADYCRSGGGGRGAGRGGGGGGANCGVGWYANFRLRAACSCCLSSE